MTTIEELYDVFLHHPTICTDTRQLYPGCIFFALKGPSFNGNSFAEGALSAGAAFAVVDEQQFAANPRCLLVKDVLEALQALAHFHRKRLNIPMLAVTGSNGKTTTKELIRAVLSMKFRTLATKGNLNNHIGVPLTLLSITDEIEFAVIEMGANHQHEIESYCLYAEPDFGLITNVGKAHLEGFGGFEGVMKGKGELYRYISSRRGMLFINADNEHLVSMARERDAENKFTYGTGLDVDCKGELLAEQPFLKISWKCRDAQGVVDSRLVGRYNFENILSAVAIGCYFGVPAEAIDVAIAAYAPDNSRSQMIKLGSNEIVLDAYNANPTSMEAAIRNFFEMKGINKIACIGDMAELGGETDVEHERIVKLLGEKAFSEVLLVGKSFGKFKEMLPCLHFEDSSQAATWMNKNKPKESLILIKGSRSTRMERLLEALEN
ncbi:MAG: UDP-N-acetylmuramoyl-tripeptide--D-alanyl-D-alanine ligase [Bacteroidota bacterium]